MFIYQTLSLQLKFIFIIQNHPDLALTTTFNKFMVLSVLRLNGQYPSTVYLRITTNLNMDEIVGTTKISNFEIPLFNLTFLEFFL